MSSRPIRLLVATRHSPLPDYDGAGAYLFDLLSYLASRGVRIHIAWLQADGALIRRGWWTVPARVHAIAHVDLPGAIAFGRLRLFPGIWWLPFKARLLHRVKSTLQFLRLMPRRASRPVQSSNAPAYPVWSALPSTAEENFFVQVAQRTRPDAVLANYCWLTPLLARTRAARKLVLTHDVASTRLALSSPELVHDPHSLNPARADGEQALLQRADAILAITDEDAAVFRARLPAREILVVPKSCLPSPPSTAPRVPGRCLFVGSANEFNREGLAWLLAEVWPRVQEAFPSATLQICGAVSRTVSEPPAGVTVSGHVADLTAVYAEASVSAVALLRGSGLKIKLVEAIMHGCPCVSTSVGLQGLSFLRDLVPVSDDPAGFAQEIVRLLRDTSSARTLGTAAQKAVSVHLSPETCYAPLHRWLAGPAPRPAVDPVDHLSSRFASSPLASAE